MNAPIVPMAICFKVELYNLFRQGSLSPTNGWRVVRYVDGCRANTVKEFAADEHGARNFCRFLNEGYSVRHWGGSRS